MSYYCNVVMYATMTNQELGILAYTKSPKTSKRTTFQDELQAAVSARASKVIMTDNYSDDFDDEEDDFLNELLKSRKKKVDAFKASKAKTVKFEFSNDEDKPAKSKSVSFLKTRRSGSPLESSQTDPSFSQQECSVGGSGNSFSSRHSPSDGSSDKRSDEESVIFQDKHESTQRNVAPLSEDALLDTPPPVPSDARKDAPDSQTPSISETPPHSKQLTETILPTPKPRQRVMAVTNLPQDKLSVSQDLNRPLAPASEPSHQCNTSNYCPNNSEETHDAGISSRSQSLSSMGDQSTKSTMESASKNGHNEDDGRDHGLSFEELTISQPSVTMDSVDQIDCPTNLESHISEHSCDTPTSTFHHKVSQKTCGGSAKVVESKYLGSLRILDRTVSPQDPESQADSLRAAVYQEWLKKKKEHLKQNMERKKKEEIIKEKKKKDQEAKREDAIASYEAWKESKLESLKTKIKEQQEKIRKAERAKEEREEKRHAAKQVFDEWKHERDLLLKERCSKARRNETEQKMEKQEKEEERQKSNNSAFLEWSEKKKNILHKRAIEKRKELKDNAETEHYLKEEKDKMAVDMYESWLAKKNQEKKRHQEEKWLQGILHDSPPPPWSPPNKTIPHGK